MKIVVLFFMKQKYASKKLFAVIFLVAFLNLAGFGIVIPLLPYYAKSFGANPFLVGLLISSYAAAQFVGSPLWGRWSDTLGRRLVLLLTIIGSVLGYVLFGLAESLIALFVSRILTGLMNGNISVVQAYVSDITDEKDRARGLGLIGAAFGLGLVLGPALGGIFSHWGFAWPAYVAAILNFLSLVAVYFWLPESLTNEHKAQPASSHKSMVSMHYLKKAFRRPLVGPALGTRFMFSLSFNIFATVFAIYAELGLGFSTVTTSYMLAYVGILMVLVQFFLIAPLAKWFGEFPLILYSVLLLIFAMAGWALAQNIVLLLIILIPMALAGGVFNTVINSVLSKIVRKDETGGILGLSMGIDSLTRIITPLLGGYLLQKYGLSAPGIAGAVFLILIVPPTWKIFSRRESS